LSTPVVSAVVFAYHDVGVRCLAALLAGGVSVPLVVTVEDDPKEQPWFASVAQAAREHELTVITPADARDPGLLQQVQELAPDFVFSFYYRALLPAPLLASARRGALNMHGSLLPKYRGRAPVNWAILKGERESGATLHYMSERADAGDIVDQLAVPILPDDDARCVMGKVTVAAETVLARSLPGLIAGTAPRKPQGELGEYFGRRRPEDGRIDWHEPAATIHNLVRAVAPPFPGAFADIGGERWWIHRTRLMPRIVAPSDRVRMFGAQGRCYVACADGGLLRVDTAVRAAGPVDLAALSAQLAVQPQLLLV
jgi:methionyl-tRNA formyltransferase